MSDVETIQRLPLGATSSSLSDFEMGDELGSGSSATVFDARFQGDRVAVKVWNAKLDGEASHRFNEECRLLWRLSDHPNVVRIVRASPVDAATAWLAMERHDESLDDRLTAGRIDNDEAVLLAEDLLAGLAAIHELKRVHRDVKPANVLLRAGRAALGDLGLAAPIGLPSAHPAAGTGLYRAPELNRGAQPGYRSDVYSAASTIQRMFDPAPPSWLSALLADALSNSPADRPADAHAFLRRFRAALEGVAPNLVQGADAIARYSAVWDGELPTVWNVPGRSAVLAGRRGHLQLLRQEFDGPRAMAVLSGIAGVGKTSVASEYAYMYATRYDLVWWIDAEDPLRVESQFDSLAIQLGLQGDRDSSLSHQALNYLARHGRWLVVFDNVEGPESLSGWLPDGPGDVLITSRNPMWPESTEVIDVNVLARADSIDLVRQVAPHLSQGDAKQLADELDDLPLALTQAAGTIAAAGIPARDYIRMMAGGVDSGGRPSEESGSLPSVLRLSLDELSGSDPVAHDVMLLLAQLGPEPIPFEWLRATSDLWWTVEPPSVLALRAALGRLAQRGLLRMTVHGPVVHRLTARLLRAATTSTRGPAARTAAIEVLLAAQPDSAHDPSTWTQWAQLRPHVLALNPADSPEAELRTLACCVLEYIDVRGELTAGLELAGQWRTAWQSLHGADDYHVLWAANLEAYGLRELGRPSESYALDVDTLERMRRIYGWDHQDTLLVAGNAALALRELGRLDEVFDLERDTLARRRETLGAGHRDTILAGNNLAFSLREAGRAAEAQQLDCETLRASLTALGRIDPLTLISAGNLATDLFTLNEFQEALRLDRVVYRLRRSALSPEHPDTLISATSLARDLRAVGRPVAAQALDELALAGRRVAYGPGSRLVRESEKNVALDREMIAELRAKSEDEVTTIGPDE